ncbi:MAG TPA: class I poly(R)-hydroxyalkanoic acid synthase [Casimicrobiaceae bacterium]|nr:class I poly(R)-hydroxyalkanoic acid synthase [Casimicrobiaceae bacterium]
MPETTSVPPFAPSSEVADLAQEWQRIGVEWLQWWARTTLPAAACSALGGPVPGAAGMQALVPAATLERINAEHQARLARLWQAAASTPPGSPLPQIVDVPDDKRFRAPAWRASPFHSLVLQSYLIGAAWLTDIAAHAELPPADRARLAFLTRQYVDALAPTNFPATNPEVLDQAIATEGASFVHGAANLAADLAHGRISMSDSSAFEVGRNIAVTPGAVVFRNELIELIQYDATTPAVHARPLVIVPPSINKYYILDLRPENSFVRSAVARGHTVFMVSWRNIPPDLGRLTWDDYLDQGVLAALSVARAITRSATANVLGFCVGGTLLACALAVLAARGDRSVASATFLTTMLDFADPGEIAVYLSPEFLETREPSLLAGQRMHGSELAAVFASLRANDLVWSYVVNNYLKGRTPPAFDLLHWNGDSANLPGPMMAYYLREMYGANRLREPGALTMLGAPVDLGRLTMPVYVLATRDDHIVPWRSAYRTTALVGGAAQFVLGASGHIAGVVNPPEPPRRNHWIADALPPDPDAWLAAARSIPGSWWPHWHAWLATHGGRRRKAPKAPGDRSHPILGPAPGRYVREAVT